MPTKFDRSSIRWTLSWLFAFTALLTVVSFGLFAYLSVRRSALDASYSRLRSATTQIVTITELGAIAELERLRSVATRPEIAAALAHLAGPAVEGAARVLAPLQGTAPDSVTVELVDSAGGSRVVGPPPPLPSSHQLEPTAAGAIGPLIEHQGTLYVQSSIAVASTGRPIGSIRVTRRLGVSAANGRIAANLLGPEARLLLGNLDGSSWLESEAIDLPRVADGPVAFTRSGATWIGQSAPVKGTPWRYAVVIPEQVALVRAHDVVVPFVLSGTLIALAGAWLGFSVSRWITAPLVDLTAVTEAIARGDQDVALPATDRVDEVGRLSRAVGTMAISVNAARQRLETEVDARTSELSTAVERLHQLDAELRRSERFAALGRLSGSASHELRNPLGVMSTVVFLLDTLPDTSPKLKDYTRLLKEQIRLSDRIISELLDRARSDAPVRSSVATARLLDDLLTSAAIPETVHVKREYDHSLPSLLIDRDQIGQIIWNLVTNAVQAMSGEGTLAINAIVSDGRLRISVRDSGPGVPPKDAERIFEPMYTTKPDGVGLGLAICRKLARSNGGELTLVSGAGGAHFMLDLPATDT